MIFLRNFSITTLNDIVYFRRKKWFLCENYYKILENEEKSWFSVCDELWRDLNPFYLIDYVKIQRLPTKIFCGSLRKNFFDAKNTISYARLSDTGPSWPLVASRVFARQFPAPETNIHLFLTFDWPESISSVYYWS